MSGRLCPPRLPGTQASLTPLLGLSEKEARIAKERELGTYKEHKVTDAPAPPRPLPLPLPFPPRGRHALASGLCCQPLAPCRQPPLAGLSRLRRRTAGGCSVGRWQRAAPAAQGPISPGRMRGPSQP